MKRFIAVLSSLLVLPAFAEVAPSYYEDVIEYTDEMDDDDEVVQDEVKTAVETKQNVVQRTNINRSTAVSRAKTSANTGTSRTNTASRAIASSKGGATTARTTTARTAKTANVVSRPRVATASRTSAATRNTQTTKPVVARVSTGQMPVMPGTKNSTLGVNTLTDSGKPLYNRVGVSSRRSNTRLASTSAVTTPVVTQEDVSTTAENMNALAELTDYCKAQYAACMDNYCNVLDDNQGRCSCSKNLKNYAKTEETLAQANEEFQEVVQKIRYIGLTGQQIESLFAETEAELTMKSTTDKSNLQSSLNNLKKKIIDVSSPTATSASAVNDLSLDATGLFNIDFTSGFDLSSFLGITGVTSASSVSNQRGEQLYKTATNRCKANVLNSCVAQGIDANVITNSYDVEIDKQCVEYERSLNEANQELRNYVLNASNILKQARLMLAQNRNAYNLRECVAAIDTCMQDDYVCGSDYEKCLDPTGKYLANGEIVKGGTPGVAGGQTVNSSPIVASTATYSSANANPPTITTATLNDWTSGGMYNLYATWNYDKDS